MAHRAGTRRKFGHMGGRAITIKKHCPHQPTKVVKLTPKATLFQKKKSHDSGQPTLQPDASTHTFETAIQAAQQYVTTPQKTTRYKFNKKKEVEAWANLREELLTRATETACPPICPMPCILCDKATLSVVHCKDCGPAYFVCMECAAKDHLFRPFHNMMIWQGKMYLPHRTQALPILCRPDHLSCTTRYLQKMTFIDHAGHEHDTLISLCKCESTASTLRRHGYWPSTPYQTTRTVYSISFLKWLEALVLTSHQSVQAFVEAVRWKNNRSPKEARSLYRLLVNECFEEYRHHAYVTRTLNYVCPGLDDGTQCPACPQRIDDVGSFMMSLDACFGLPHKRSAGTSFEGPKHGQRLFLSRDLVSQFVDNYEMNKTVKDGECHNFLAGDIVRSKNKSSKLDVTGVFGSVCKHEIPLKFLNLQHGERLAYPVYLLLLLKEQYSHLDKLHVLYDIACVLTRHLKKREDGKRLLDGLHLALPMFHCYGHEAACQVAFSPRRHPGFGMVDGEALERFWSFVRHFGPMTKEMTASHRIDLLTDAFIYYGDRKKDSLGEVLVQQYNAAHKAVDSSEKQLQDLLQCYGVTPSEPVLMAWEKEEKEGLQTYKQKRKMTQNPKSWQEQYVADILLVDSLQSQLSVGDTGEEQVLAATIQYKELEAKIADVETKYGITRWHEDQDEFQHHLCSLEDRQKIQLLSKMLASARERQFLQSLQKKHGIGQAITEKLSRQINRCCLSIRKAAKVYNEAKFRAVGSKLPATFSMVDVFNPLSEIFELLELQSDVQGDVQIPLAAKREALELRFRKKRAVEEVVLKEQEMCNMLKFYRNLHEKLWAAITDLDEIDSGTNIAYGKKAMLFQKGLEVERKCSNLFSLFSSCVTDLDPLVQCFTPNTICEPLVEEVNCDEEQVIEEDLDRMLHHDIPVSDDVEIEDDLIEANISDTDSS